MFESGLIKIGNDYIAPASGFFFCCIQEMKRKKPDKLEAQIMDADIEIFPVSEPFMLRNDYECILFAADGFPLLPVQTKYLEVIGVNLSEIITYTFMLNKETLGIFVYDPDLIGGVMPMVGGVTGVKEIDGKFTG